MPLKLKAECEDRMIVPAEESLWDKIEYLFTSDKSISEKIGNMIYQLGKLEEDDVRALESTHVKFKMQNFATVQKMMSFSGQAVDFVVSNTRKFENKAYALLENEREEIQQEIESAYSSFASSHDVSEMTELLSNSGVVKDKTYAQLGYTHTNLLTVAKEFKDNQSGRLTRMKKMKFISNVVARTPSNFQLKVIHEAAFKFAKLMSVAIDTYKYVDKFLFYTYKELCRKEIIKA